MDNACCKVCVTGGSGYIGSWLVMRLLENGFSVHATLRNLEDPSKVGFLKSLPNAETRLTLFQADIYNPVEFEPAIKGCEFVFHVATPLHHDPRSSIFEDTTEAAIAGVRTIADSCILAQTVKRLIYTASVVSSSPMEEDGMGFKSCLDESCWTPLDISLAFSTEFWLDYVKSKTLSEKVLLSYNEIGNGKLEVVTIPCALVGGETLLSYVPSSVAVLLSQLTGNALHYQSLIFLERLLGSVPLVHIEDVCQAHIFCMEQPSMKGRFLCAVSSSTVGEIAMYAQKNHPESKITEQFMGEKQEGVVCDSNKLMTMGFEYKYDTDKIFDDSLQCVKRLQGLLSEKIS